MHFQDFGLLVTMDPKPMQVCVAKESQVKDDKGDDIHNNNDRNNDKGKCPPKNNEKVKTFAIRGQTRAGETRIL